MDACAPQLEFDLPDGGHLRARVFSRAYPGGLGQFDDNWLNVELKLRGEARSWTSAAFLRTGDFAAFHRQLTALQEGGADRAGFEPTDPWMWIAVERRPDGRYGVGLVARDGHTDKALRVVLDLDAGGLLELTRQVATVVDAFPVI